MFTGIIEEIGTIRSLSMQGHSGSIEIQAQKILEDTKIGESIAVNGICLTVTSLGSHSFTADVMVETARRSNLEQCRIGDTVNLERAMAADSRFGGHIVSGHIDGTGTLIAKETEENAVWLTIRTDFDILRYIIKKGSIAIDGVSLTVAYVDQDVFKISVIPHTASQTTLLDKRIGHVVNLENDIIGKYVEKLMTSPSDDSALTLEFLVENGF